MNIGILGAGNIATTMAMTLQSVKGANCYAIASRDIRKAQEFADKFDFEKAYGAYGDMLSDPAVELVYIATPHSHHFEHMKMCLEHNKPVICEKAFTANAAQAEEIMALFEQRGLFLTEAMWTRYMPMRFMIEKVIRSGIIGNPTSLSANLGYPLEHVKRLVKPELAGGALLDLGVYVLNFASMVFGDEIKGIVADCIKYDSGVDAQETIMLSYRDGKMATLYSTMLAQTDRRGIINGTNGYIEIENINNFESIRVYNLERRIVAEHAAPVQITGYEYEIRSAMQAISEGRIECPEMPHYETIRMMQLMDSLREAWGIRFPFEGSHSGTKTSKDGGKRSKAGKGGNKGVRMITEQTVKEGIRTELMEAPPGAVLKTAEEEADIRNMINIIHTPPIDKRGENKKDKSKNKAEKNPSGSGSRSSSSSSGSSSSKDKTNENNLTIIKSRTEKIKSRPSGLRAQTPGEMREKLENETAKEAAGKEDPSGGFIGDIDLHENNSEDEHKVIRIVDESVSDLVNIEPDGSVTIDNRPKTEIKVNEELLRKLSPNSVPLEDEGVVSEVFTVNDRGERVTETAYRGREEKESSIPDEKKAGKTEEKKTNPIGRFLNSVFRSDQDRYDDDNLDE